MLRLLLWGCPGSPVEEVGDHLSEFHDIDFFTIGMEDVDNHYQPTISTYN